MGTVQAVDDLTQSNQIDNPVQSAVYGGALRRFGPRCNQKFLHQRVLLQEV